VRRRRLLVHGWERGLRAGLITGADGASQRPPHLSIQGV